MLCEAMLLCLAGLICYIAIAEWQDRVIHAATIRWVDVTFSRQPQITSFPSRRYPLKVISPRSFDENA